ncbi:Six-hairpin glycosidase, partial [Rhizodiscina lignyota]
WTAGFFPNMLWESYKRRKYLQSSAKYQGEPSLDSWLQQARAWTDPLITNVNLTNTHDVGFLSFPFDAALELDPDRSRANTWLPVLQQMSYNLAARFVPAPGVIRSWDTNNNSAAMRGSHEDSVLVIIDNMMNLALLARSAFEYTRNHTLLEIAISHANRTRDHHIRPDGSSFHVCDYSADTGQLYLCRTAQGLADNSTWARGQAWAIYGFVQMYSYTKDPSYLATSLKCADWFLDRLPADGVPFWDFDAPYLPDQTPRDTSAATIAASGLILLQEQLAGTGFKYAGNRNYQSAAIRLLRDAISLA